MNGIINNRNAAFGAAAFVLAVLAGASSFADDIVGVMSVDVGTNGLAEVEMPFSHLYQSPARRPATSRSPTPVAKLLSKRPRRSSTEFGIL